MELKTVIPSEIMQSQKTSDACTPSFADWSTILLYVIICPDATARARNMERIHGSKGE